jgi:hypothetical protein
VAADPVAPPDGFVDDAPRPSPTAADSACGAACRCLADGAVVSSLPQRAASSARRAGTGSYRLVGGCCRDVLRRRRRVRTLRGRLIDRLGSRAVLAPLVISHAASLLALAACGEARRGTLIVVAAGCTGLSAPALPAAMRLEWQRLLARSDSRLDRAQAVESIAQVPPFIVGPVPVGAGIAALGAARTWSRQAHAPHRRPRLRLQWRASPARVGGHHKPARTPIRLPGVRTLVIATLLAVAALGAVWVALVRRYSSSGANFAAPASSPRPADPLAVELDSLSRPGVERAIHASRGVHRRSGSR